MNLLHIFKMGLGLGVALLGFQFGMDLTGKLLTMQTSTPAA